MGRSRIVLVGAVVLSAVLALGWCVLAAPVGEISGTVTDDTGEPIVGARVQAWRYETGAGRPAEAATDPAGQYTIPDVPAGRHWVVATAQDHRNAGSYVDVAVDEDVRVDFQLDAVCWLTGRALIGPGEPLSNATVTLYFPRRSSRLDVSTGPDGAYRAELSRPLLQGIIALAPGIGCALVPDVTPSAGRDSKPIDIIFDPGAPPILGLVGTVTDDLGDAIAGAAVSLSRTDHFRIPDGVAHTDETGSFAIHDVLPGPHDLSISAPGHEAYSSDAEPLVLVASAILRRDVFLRRICAVSGTLYGLTEEPLGNAKVQFHFRTYHGWKSRTVTTDSEGRYSTTCPEPCLGDVVFKAPGYAAIERRDVPFGLGEELSGMNFVLDAPPATIAGVARGPDGTALEHGAGLWLVMIDGPKWKRMSGTSDLRRIMEGTKDLDGRFIPEHPRTNEDGTFFIEDIDAGTYRIVAHAPGSLPEATEPIVIGRSGNVRDVAMVLQPSSSISGTLYDPDGRPMADRRVYGRLRTHGDDASSSRSAPVSTDGHGRYSIDGLRPGKYEIELRAANAAPAAREAEVGPGQELPGLDFRFRQGNVLTVSVVGPDGEPVLDATVSVSKQEAADNYGAYRARESVDEEGRARFEHLREGGYDIRVTSPTAPRATWGTHLPGAPEHSQEVRIVLQEGATITGRVTDEDGTPIAGAQVRAYCRVPDSIPGEQLSLRPFPDLTTDDEGYFIVPTAGAGAWSCYAEAPGYIRGRASVEVHDQRQYSVDVTMRKAWSGVLRGHVLMPDGATPAAHTEFDVELLARDELGKTKSVRGTRILTDANGDFHLEVDRGVHGAKFFADGQTPTTVDIAPSAARIASVTVQLPRPTGLRGTVELGEAEIPPDGLYVLAVPPGEEASLPTPDYWGPRPKGGCATVMPGETHWEIRGVEPGDYTVFTYAPELAASVPVAVSVAEGETAEVTVDAVLPGAISGTVRTVDGKPVVMAWVYVSTGEGRVRSPRLGIRTRTDAQGWFRVDGLTPGVATVRMGVEALGYATPPGRDVSVAPGAETEAVDFELFVGGQVTGTVRRRDGEPLVRQYGAKLKLDSVRNLRALVNPDGTFKLERVHPGAYDVSLYIRGYVGAEPVQTLEDIIVPDLMTAGGITFIIDE